MTSTRADVRRSVLILAAAVLAGCSAASAPDGDPNVIDRPGGVKRVTLTGNYSVSLVGRGWKLATHTITESAPDSDFHLYMSQIISLSPTTDMNGICRMASGLDAAAFTRVEDVPGDVTSCASWSPTSLGGNSAHSESLYAGQGYLVRDRTGIANSKLLTISDSIIGGDVSVTFDVIGF